ncbi:MAG: tripartite tricarboxylate transporter TctB family protein [Firmicutes bacterium]|nr:tripartite tricarboxylate transporter TctB family protein [Bacillota bacterium]
MGEIVFYIALIIASSVLYLNAGTLPSPPWEPLGSGSFPQMVFGLMAVLSLVGLIQKVREYRKSTGREKFSFSQYKVVGLVFLLFTLYVAVFNFLGFIISTALFLIVTMWLIGPKTKRSLPLITVIALAFSVGMFYVFRVYLYVYLPLGVFFQ